VTDPTAVALPADDLEGLTLSLDPSASVIENGRVLLGGSPLRLARLTEEGAALVRRLAVGEPVPAGRAATELARRLLDGGLVHPDLPRCGLDRDDVTVVVPVRGRLHPALAEQLVAASGRTRVIVVDDASETAVADPGGAVEVVRRETCGGPSAARNTGLGHVRTALTAFVDADCVPDANWLDGLFGHFGDPLVAAVAPRVTSPDTTGAPALARYEAMRSPLDLGTLPSRVRARTRVAYVPSAALVARTDVVRGLGGFDETMAVGEDVDLVWRLDEAGWSVRYEPTVEVVHHHRTAPAGWLRRRFDYGTSAGPLAVRHPGALAPVEASPWSIAVWGLLATGHPLAAAVAGATTVDLLARGLASLDHPFPVAARIAAQAHLATARMLSDAVVRPWWPLAVAVGVTSRRGRRVALAAAVGPPLWDWARTRPPLDPVRWVAFRLADQVAYAAGVWTGSARARTADPLVPELTSWPRPGRYTRWRTSLTRR
jgi:mycofactocin system glycosyltransferase